MLPTLTKIAFIAAYLFLTACTSLAPERCSSDWFAWKTRKITDSFVRKNKQKLQDLQLFAAELEDPTPTHLLQMTDQLSAFQALATEFANDTLPEISQAFTSCGTSAEFAQAFRTLLQDQGIDGVVLQWAEEISHIINADEA